MKRLASWLAVISIIVFVIDWGVVGLKLYDGDYDITVGTYIGMVSIVIFFVCILYVKSTNRCPHCGKMKLPFGKYCPYCGGELDK